jgi:hypothetical protein
VAEINTSSKLKHTAAVNVIKQRTKYFEEQPIMKFFYEADTTNSSTAVWCEIIRMLLYSQKSLRYKEVLVD